MAKITSNLFGELAVLPFPSKAPMTETLEWLTDVLTSFNGTESRTQLRNNPRHRLVYEIPEQRLDKLRSYLTFYGGNRSRWAVPHWAEVQFLGPVVVGTTDLLCNTENFDFRENSLAMLWQSTTNWQIVEIGTIEPGVLHLTGFTQGYTNAYLLPVRIGALDGDVQRVSNGYNGASKIAFELSDNKALAETIPGQYLGNDLYLEPGLFADDSISSEVTTRVDKIDYDLGVVDRRYPWANNRDQRPKHSLCEGAAEVRAYRQWLMRRAGRLRPYWEPTFENDLTVRSVGTVLNKLNIDADDGFQDWERQRKHIAVRMKDGSWLCREVTAVADPSFGMVELTLDTALNVPAASILFVSFLGLRRLDTDRVELNWIGNGVMRSTVNTVEIEP